MRYFTLTITLLTWILAHHPLLVCASDTERVVSRIFFGSCIKQDLPMPILSVMAAQSPDLTIMLGDNIYADTSDMELMKAKYAKLGANASFQKLRRAAPLLATWDDHDYGVNDGGAEFPQRAEAQRIFNDFWLVPANDPRRTRPGVYHAQVYGPPGKRLQVILLDTRYFRSPLKQGERRVGGPYVADNDPSKTMLGDTQWHWLRQQLRQPAELRLLCTSIQCLAESAGQETWSNLPRERGRLFATIKEAKANGVILISGDRHWSELSRVDDAVGYPLLELTSSSFNQIHSRGTPTVNRYRVSETTYHKENFGVLEIDWAKADVPVILQIRDLQNQKKIVFATSLAALQPSK